MASAVSSSGFLTNSDAEIPRNNAHMANDLNYYLTLKL